MAHHDNLHFRKKNEKSQKISFFRNFQSPGISWIWRWHCLFYILIHLSKSSIYSGQEILCTFFSKIMQNMVISTKFFEVVPFCAGPSLAGLATVSVWQSCGKPSTKFPHGGLVEWLTIKISIFKKNIFSKFLDPVEPYGSDAGIVSSTF